MTCRHYGCLDTADVVLIQDDGRENPGGYYCRTHGQAIVDEYAAKLGETWTLAPINDLGTMSTSTRTTLGMEVER